METKKVCRQRRDVANVGTSIFINRVNPSLLLLSDTQPTHTLSHIEQYLIRTTVRLKVGNVSQTRQESRNEIPSGAQCVKLSEIWPKFKFTDSQQILNEGQKKVPRRMKMIVSWVCFDF